MIELFQKKVNIYLLFCVSLFLLHFSIASPQNSTKKEVKSRLGLWHSKLSTLNATSTSNLFQEGPKVDPITGGIFWIQKDKNEKNSIYEYNLEKEAIVRWTSRKYDVKNKVNGRGGGSFIVYNNTIFFSNGKDNLLYIQENSTGIPVRLTQDSSKAYADGCYSPEFNILFYVKEDLTTHEQFIAAINVTSKEETILPTDGEFFAAPTLSPDSTKLSWIQWNAPVLPWDETKLLVTSLEVGRNAGYLKFIQHGSMMMPKWNLNNELLYVHDASDWWNLYVNNKKSFELNLTPLQEDVGRPFMRFGQMAYDINPQIGNNDVVVAVGKSVYIVNSANEKRRNLNLSMTSFFEPKFSKDGQKVYLLAANWTESLALIEVDLKTSNEKVLFSSPRPLVYEDISQPSFIQFPSTNNESAFGFLYKPKNSNVTSRKEKILPPLIINIRGALKERVKCHLNLEVQYFTTRGFAYLDLVNRASSSFGRKYRQSLYGKLGTTDTDDVISAAKYLIKEGTVDPEKIVLRGISSGGFTALVALSQSDLFKAGTICRGISNMTKHIENATRFEKPFYKKLFFPSENKENFTDIISPINHSNNITAQTLFFHGLHDKIINVNQTIEMHKKLLAEGKVSEMVLMKAGNELSRKTKARCLQLELRFYRKVFNPKDTEIELV